MSYSQIHSSLYSFLHVRDHISKLLFPVYYINLVILDGKFEDKIFRTKC